MNTVKIQELEAVAFQTFGTFANMINPTAYGFGKPPVQFYRDIIQQQIGEATTISYSICRVEARPPVISSGEYHNRCCEGVLPLDNDILIHVGPGTHPRAGMPVDQFQVFRVPMGTMVVVRPGVWHHAPFSANDKPANVLVVLPERTYVNDCEAIRVEDEANKLEIVG
jgi:ureidoglycolate lyase